MTTSKNIQQWFAATVIAAFSFFSVGCSEDIDNDLQDLQAGNVTLSVGDKPSYGSMTKTVVTDEVGRTAWDNGDQITMTLKFYDNATPADGNLLGGEKVYKYKYNGTTWVADGTLPTLKNISTVKSLLVDVKMNHDYGTTGTNNTFGTEAMTASGLNFTADNKAITPTKQNDGTFLVTFSLEKIENSTINNHNLYIAVTEWESKTSLVQAINTAAGGVLKVGDYSVNSTVADGTYNFHLATGTDKTYAVTYNSEKPTGDNIEDGILTPQPDYFYTFNTKKNAFESGTPDINQDWLYNEEAGYIIFTGIGLQEVLADKDAANKNITLANNIDMSGLTIENKINTYTGTFDGGGFTISNFEYEGTENSGLIKSLSSSGKVKNLTLTNAKISGTKYIGGIVGYNNGGTIENCHVDGKESKISGDGSSSHTGGIVGWNNLNSLVKLCSIGAIEITGKGNVGGIVGSNKSAILAATAQNSIITASNNANSLGGIVGENDKGGVVASFVNNVQLKGTSTFAGSIAGKNNYYIVGSYSKNNTLDGTNISDRFQDKNSDGEGFAVNCVYNKSNKYYYFSKDTEKYEEEDWGTVAGNPQDADDNTLNQGIAHWNENANHELTMHWDPTNVETLIDGAPRAYMHYKLEGNTYKVYTSKGLAQVSQEIKKFGNYNYNITLHEKTDGETQTPATRTGTETEAATNVIDMSLNKSTITFVPIGTQSNPYKGTFDGNGITIKNLTYVNLVQDNVGLIGYADGATIKGVTLKDVSIMGGSNVGGIVGFANKSKIEGCSVIDNRNTSTISTATIVGSSGSYYIGGIVGFNNYSTIDGCTVQHVYIKGHNHVGGIVGRSNNSIVMACLAKSSKIVAEYSSGYNGGIVGYEGGGGDGIKGCFAYECEGLIGHEHIYGSVYSSIDYIKGCYYSADGTLYKVEDDSTNKEWNTESVGIKAVMNTEIAKYNSNYHWTGDNAANAKVELKTSTEGGGAAQ